MPGFGMGRIGLGRMGGPATPGTAPFDPAALFKGGEKGFVFDFTNPATLFQDVGGTVAVAADTDPIGRAADLSGNGNHAVQATNARRPVFRTSARRASFNAARLATVAIDLRGGNKATLILSMRNSGSANAVIVESSSNYNTTAGAMIVSVTPNGALSVGARGDASVGARAAPNITRPYERLVDLAIDIGGATLADEVALLVDGAVPVLTDAFGPLGGGNLGNHAFHLGARANDTLPATADLFRVVLINRALTVRERADVSRWVGEPVGFSPIATMAAGAAGIEHLISYGQSLSVGVGTGGVRLTNQPHDSLMFSGGVRAQDGGTEPWTQHGALVPLVEAQGPAAAGGDRYETPLSGMALMARQRGASPRFLASAPGQGATAIATLSRPGALYDRLLDDVRYGRARARGIGQSYKCRQFLWMQGEADGANSGYAAALNTLRTTIDADVKAITGQAEDVWCISYQLDRPKIGLAQLAASDAYPCIRVAMPIYPLARTDGVHLTAAASDIAGAYFALARERIVDQGDTGWQPLRIVGHAIQGAVIDLSYAPVGSLVFDTATVPAQSNYGFRLFDSMGGPATIATVAIVDGNMVRITATAPLMDGAIVCYGFSNVSDHTADVSKGNLRDSQGDAIVFEGQGLNHPMHNWAVLEQVLVGG